jgi:AcrR family transcriptional regulator
MARDPDQTRRKLLDAATSEFAEQGIAGARVDRIAERAQVNKRMIYAYFGNKEQLFETVIAHSLEDLLDAVPLQVEDLPAYAGQLFDYLIAHPERRRLALWRLLERPAATAAETRSTARKVAALSRARPHDHALDGTAILTFIMAIVQAWPNAGRGLAPTKAAKLTAQRASVVEAVRRLTDPPTA